MRAPLAHLVVQPRGECRGALRSGAQASDAIVSVCWCPRLAQRLEEEALPSATSSARVEASRSPPAFLPRQSRQCSDQCQPPMLRTDLAGGACSAGAGARRHAPRPTRRAFATWSSEARVLARVVRRCAPSWLTFGTGCLYSRTKELRNNFLRVFIKQLPWRSAGAVLLAFPSPHVFASAPSTLIRMAAVSLAPAPAFAAAGPCP